MIISIKDLFLNNPDLGIKLDGIEISRKGKEFKIERVGSGITSFVSKENVADILNKKNLNDARLYLVTGRVWRIIMP